MSSNTKIVVLRSRELVYALVLMVVSVLIIMVAVSLFMPSDTAPKDSAPAQSPEETMSEVPTEAPADTPANDTSIVPGSGTASAADLYIPGIYSSTLQLGSSNVELQITVDKNHINSISLANLDESVTTLYPLVHPTLTELAAVILSEQSIENVSYSEENRYTSMLLMQAIRSTLDKAVISENADRPETGVIY